eukprot:gene5489-9307_t
MLSIKQEPKKFQGSQHYDNSDTDTDSEEITRHSTKRIKKKITENSPQEIKSYGSNFECCFVCQISFQNYTSKQIESHVNACLDEEAARKYASYNSDEESQKTKCPFCDKDLTLYNTKRQEQHLNRCRENEKKSQEEEPIFNTDECLICQKNISTLQQKAKTSHLKLCAKIKKLKPKEVVELLALYKKPKKKTKKEEINDSNDIFDQFKYDAKSKNVRVDLIPRTVKEWLVSLKMESYIESFIENGYDSLEVCCELEKDDLICVNVTKPGHVKRFLLAAKELKENINSKPKYIPSYNKNARVKKNIKIVAPPPKPTELVEEIETPKKTKKVKVFQEELDSNTPLLQIQNRKSNEEVANLLLKDLDYHSNIHDESLTQPLGESLFNSKPRLWGLSTSKFTEKSNEDVVSGNTISKENKKRNLDEKEESPPKYKTILNSHDLDETSDHETIDTVITRNSTIQKAPKSLSDSILDFDLYSSTSQKIETNTQSDHSSDDLCVSFSPENKKENETSNQDDSETDLKEDVNMKETPKLHEENAQPKEIVETNLVNLSICSINDSAVEKSDDVCLSQELNLESKEEEQILSQKSVCSITIEDDSDEEINTKKSTFSEELNNDVPEDDYFFTPEEEVETTIEKVLENSDTNIDEDVILQDKYDSKCSSLVQNFKENVKKLYENLTLEISKEKEKIEKDYPRSMLLDYHLSSIFSISPQVSLDITPIESSEQIRTSTNLETELLATPVLEETQSFSQNLMTQIPSQTLSQNTEEPCYSQTQSQPENQPKKKRQKKSKKSKEPQAMPDFESMSIEDLKKHLSKFGVKPGKKKYMVEKLIQIHNATAHTNI